MADISVQVDTLARSLVRVFEINEGNYSPAERFRECREALLAAFRLGAMFKADVVDEFHVELGRVVERSGWRCLRCGFEVESTDAMNVHLLEKHPDTDEGAITFQRST